MDHLGRLVFFSLHWSRLIDSEAKVDMVRCKLDNKLYVRKSVEKRVVTRNPSVCVPVFLRNLSSHKPLAMLSTSRKGDPDRSDRAEFALGSSPSLHVSNAYGPLLRDGFRRRWKSRRSVGDEWSDHGERPEVVVAANDCRH